MVYCTLSITGWLEAIETAISYTLFYKRKIA